MSDDTQDSMTVDHVLAEQFSPDGDYLGNCEDIASQRVLAAEVRRLRGIEAELDKPLMRELKQLRAENAALVAKVKRAVADLLLFESNLEALTSANASGRRIAYRAAAEYVAALFGADVETAPKRPSVAPIDGGEEPQP